MSFTVVENPLIEFVIDYDGRELNVKEFNLTREKISIMRGRAYLEEDKPQQLCYVCFRPVWPKMDQNRKKFHFSHVSQRSNQGTALCSLQEKKKNPEYINARRYNGQKEGPDHKKLKNILEASLKADPNFSEINVEKNWYSADESQWRRPDVATTHLKDGQSLKIAFEIQLSSTFLKVMRERRNFYLKENALLFWVFKDARIINPRQYQDDLFYNNNHNLFVIDQDTLELSQQRGKLFLKCFYSKPVLNETRVEEDWQAPEFVEFEQLKKDPINQRVFWFDYDGELNRLQEQAILAALEAKRDGIRTNYIEFANLLSKRDGYSLKVEYLKLRSDFKKIGIVLSENIPQDLQVFNRLVFSAKAGEPVMTRLKTLLEVANDGFVHGKKMMWYFGQVLKYYERGRILRAQDANAARRKKSIGKSHEGWDKKGETITKGYLPGGEFEPDRAYEDLFYFLFPELSKKNQETN